MGRPTRVSIRDSDDGQIFRSALVNSVGSEIDPLKFNSTVCVVSNGDIPEDDMSEVAAHHSIFPAMVADVIFIDCWYGRFMPVENSQAIVSDGVRHVVAKFAKFGIRWLDIRVK